MDGKPTDNVTEFMQLLRHDLVTGQRVEMEVFRNWNKVDLEIIIGERPADQG